MLIQRGSRSHLILRENDTSQRYNTILATPDVGVP
jgi:hypothetical protein